MMYIAADADACPGATREILCGAAVHPGTLLILISRRPVAAPAARRAGQR